MRFIFIALIATVGLAACQPDYTSSNPNGPDRPATRPVSEM